jgi:hypothetical protein
MLRRFQVPAIADVLLVASQKCLYILRNCTCS